MYNSQVDANHLLLTALRLLLCLTVFGCHDEDPLQEVASHEISDALMDGDSSASVSDGARGGDQFDLRPQLSCVEPYGTGAFRAHWGYVNHGPRREMRKVGPRNKFMPKPEDQGQPTLFQRGIHADVFTTVFAKRRSSSWQLDDYVALADSKSPRCGSDAGAGGDPDAGSHDAGRDGGPDGGTLRLTRIYSGPNMIPLHGVAIAVDAAQRVFIKRTDLQGVHVIANGVQSLYLSEERLGEASGEQRPIPANDVALAPDDSLLVLTGASILRSTAADVATTHLAEGGASFSLVATGRFLAARSNALVVISEGAVSPLRPPAPCAADVADLAVDRTGAFLAIEGCNGGPLVRGNVDSGTFETLFDFFAPRMLDGKHISHFRCISTAPTGGFYVLLEFDQSDEAQRDVHLYHFAADFSEERGMAEIKTSPSFAQTAASGIEVGDTTFFYNCSLAVDPRGDIFVASDDQVWRAGP